MSLHYYYESHLLHVILQSVGMHGHRYYVNGSLFFKLEKWIERVFQPL